MTFEISPSCPCNTAVHAPVKTLYTHAVPSALAVTSLLPVELKQASKTSSVCPLNVSMQFPDPTSHNFAVLSMEPVTQYSPVKSN